jgi:hypothetical protein
MEIFFILWLVLAVAFSVFCIAVWRHIALSDKHLRYLDNRQTRLEREFPRLVYTINYKNYLHARYVIAETVNKSELSVYDRQRVDASLEVIEYFEKTYGKHDAETPAQ